MFFRVRIAISVLFAIFFVSIAAAQQASYAFSLPLLSSVSGHSEGSGETVRQPVSPVGYDIRPFSKVAVSANVSSLGAGVSTTFPLTHSLNLRTGWNAFSFGLKGRVDGATYNGNLNWHSYQAGLDWFPWHNPFHISPGLLFNNKNGAKASGNVPLGQTINLNGTYYFSSSADPATGTGTIRFATTDPVLTFGWGNVVSRREGHHISFPVEIGMAYAGKADIHINMNGSLCRGPNNFECGTVAGSPEIAANLQGQIRKLQHELHLLSFYPVISTGVAVKF
jgi:hypothetical protein